MRRIGWNIALAFAAFAAMILAAEVAWRLLFTNGDRSRVFDQRFGLINPPNAEWSLRTPEYSTVIRTNALGFRTGEFPAVRVPDERRLLFLGDSFVEAKQVAEEERFGERVADRLAREGGGPVAVAMLGVGGANPARELLFYRNAGRAFDPDIVIQVLFPENDLFPMDGPYRLSGKAGRLHVDDVWAAPPPPCGIKCRLLRKSVLLRQAYVALRGVGRVADGELLGDFAWYTRGGLERLEREQRINVLAAFVSALRDEVVRDGARFVAVLMPGALEIQEEWQREVIERSGIPRDKWRPEELLYRVSAVLRERGIPVLDLRPAFRDMAASGTLLYYRRDPHLRPEGHALVTEQILTFLHRE